LKSDAEFTSLKKNYTQEYNPPSFLIISNQSNLTISTPHPSHPKPKLKKKKRKLKKKEILEFEFLLIFI